MHSFWLCLHLELHLQLSLKVASNDVKLHSSIFLQTSSKFVCYFSFQLFLRKVEMEFLHLHLSIMRVALIECNRNFISQLRPKLSRLNFKTQNTQAKLYLREEKPNKQLKGEKKSQHFIRVFAHSEQQNLTAISR